MHRSSERSCEAQANRHRDTTPTTCAVVFEQRAVGVREYADGPGDRTTPHEHPNSVMVTLSSFRRRLYSGEVERDVDISAESASWLPAQQHSGHNIGDTPTHVIFVELKDSAAGPPAAGPLGPS